MTNAAEDIEDVDLPVNEDAADDQQQVVEQAEKPDETQVKFISRDDWIASGKDPDEWRSPREFRERGEIIEQNKELRKTIERERVKRDSEISNLNLLHSIQINNAIKEAELRRDNAIDIADKSEVRRIDAEIKDLNMQAELVKDKPAQQQVQNPKEVEEFMDDNPWARDAADPRTIYANKIIDDAMTKGKTLAGALRVAELAVVEKFTNPKKTPVAIVESSRTAGKTSQASGALSWSQLTPAEEKCYIPGMWKSEAEFLKAVANDRKGSK